MNLTLRSPAAGGALVLSLYVLACLMAAGHAVAAGDGTHAPAVHFEILPQGLASALALFSEASGYALLIGGELVAGRQSAGVHGDMPPRQALHALLQGSGLEARFIGSQAFTLAPQAAASEGQSDAQDAPVQSGAATAAPLADDFSYALQRAISRALCQAQPGSFGRDRLGLQLWLSATGKITELRLLASSGAVQRDRQVAARLRGLDIGVTPPPALSQPLIVLLTPRPDPEGDCRYFAGQALR